MLEGKGKLVVTHLRQEINLIWGWGWDSIYWMGNCWEALLKAFSEFPTKESSKIFLEVHKKSPRLA